MKRFKLYWSPSGLHFQTVEARTERAACRKADQPYRKYLGEIYAVEVDSKEDVAYTINHAQTNDPNIVAGRIDQILDSVVGSGPDRLHGTPTIPDQPEDAGRHTNGGVQRQ